MTEQRKQLNWDPSPTSSANQMGAFGINSTQAKMASPFTSLITIRGPPLEGHDLVQDDTESEADPEEADSLRQSADHIPLSWAASTSLKEVSIPCPQMD